MPAFHVRTVAYVFQRTITPVLHAAAQVVTLEAHVSLILASPSRAKTVVFAHRCQRARIRVHVLVRLLAAIVRVLQVTLATIVNRILASLILVKTVPYVTHCPKLLFHVHARPAISEAFVPSILVQRILVKTVAHALLFQTALFHAHVYRILLAIDVN